MRHLLEPFHHGGLHQAVVIPGENLVKIIVSLFWVESRWTMGKLWENYVKSAQSLCLTHQRTDKKQEWCQSSFPDAFVADMWRLFPKKSGFLARSQLLELIPRVD
jgi:hypothetical protein